MTPSLDPGIHISLSILKGIIKQANGLTGDDLADYILKEGKNYTLFHRKGLDRYDSKARKTISKLSSSTLQDARLFSSLLVTIRKGELKHKGVLAIREGTKDWATIKEATSKALAFAEAYDMDKRSAFIRYIRLFFALAGRGRMDLRTLAGKFDYISATHEASMEIAEDQYPESTAKCHIEYSAEISKRTGIPINYSDQPTKYVFFVYAAELARKYGLTPAQFIRASFDTMDWTTSGIPGTNQLITKNAEERIIRWMAEKKIAKMTVTKSNGDAKAFWDKVKSYADRTQ